MTTTDVRGPATMQARGTRLARLGAALLLLAGGVVGCGVSTPAARDDGVAVAYYEPTGTGGDGALLAGVVEDHDGCLVVVQTDAVDGEKPPVPVFASDDHRGRDVTVGSTVELGGGGPPGLDEAWDHPSTCPADGPFFVVAQPE